MSIRKQRVSIIGLGYVGLCTAAAFSSKGYKTIGIDIDAERIKVVVAGKSPVHEPGLDSLLKTSVRKKQLEATTDITAATNTDVTFLAVGTPSRPDGSIDLRYIQNATLQLGKALADKSGYHLVIVKSTVVPGTTDQTVKQALEESSGRQVGPGLGLVANPEFLREGTAINDTLHPDKIVIGGNDKKSVSILVRLYRQFYRLNTPPIIKTNPATAELIKYASNAFLATKVSFINTIANIAQQTFGVDVEKIAEAIGYDPRIGSLFLKAGPGYGGSCFHKDLQALISYGKAQGYDPALLRATEETNQQQAARVVELSEKLLGSLDGKRIAVLGIAFKKDTDDIREAASIRVIDGLRMKNARVVAYDPMAMPNAKRVFADSIDFAQDARSALTAADCCIVMTEWDEFRKLKSKDYEEHMRTPNIVDARRIYDPEQFKELRLEGIGLGPTRK